MVDRYKEIREKAESDLEAFITLVAPKRLLGSIHSELISWWTRSDRKTHQLTLLPRDHMKSALIAYRVAWHITKFPDCRILYISSTANLAEKQLKFIKDILTSTKYQKYWPNHVNAEEGLREKWTATEIAIDHRLRKEEGVRDPTVFTGGLTTSLTGLHCDVAVLDDVVVFENAYTEEGRNRVMSQYSLLSSIEGGDAEEWVVGTRYHPKDLYSRIIAMEEEDFDEEGNVIGHEKVYEVFERAVEDVGDGSGEYLWPRQQRSDGKWFGFDYKILAKKRAKYLDKTQYRAQYYNDPNDPDGGGISQDKFQYYERSFLTRTGGVWYNNGRRLNVVAAIDFAYSLNKKADWSSIVVVGIDADRNYYVLDIERFKTDQISEYFKAIFNMYIKWGFKKLRAEVTAAQKIIVKDLKDNYIRPNGIALSVDDFSPTRHQGTKAERIAATLDHKYENGQMWHYHAGNCQVLEEELKYEHPAHDDVKNALADAVDIAVPPSNHLSSNSNRYKSGVEFNKRFGGVAH